MQGQGPIRLQAASGGQNHPFWQPTLIYTPKYFFSTVCKSAAVGVYLIAGSYLQQNLGKGGRHYRGNSTGQDSKNMNAV
jgi:hypothetical protein